MIPIRDRKTDIASEVAQGKALQKKLVRLAEEAANESISSHTELNDVIAAITKRENLNRLQIQRLVEESNTIAYNKRYDKLRGSHDRRISFPIASLEGVIEVLGFAAPPEITNPNLSTGGPGEGEISKAASVQIESSPIHNPHSKVRDHYERQLEKTASLPKKETAQAEQRQQKEKKSAIFKIANSIVMSERQYKNGNEIYNTLLSDVSLTEEDKESISKTASTIAEHLVKTRRSRPGFMVTLKQNSMEKVADHILGEYSLLKEAEDSPKVKEITIHPTQGIADFSQLVDLAKKLEIQQKSLVNQPAKADSEVR